MNITKQILKENNKTLRAIRQAVADYMATEGCSCCQDWEGHTKAQIELAKLLKVPMYPDKSGYQFYKYRTKNK